jgi:hypothetical protein
MRVEWGRGWDRPHVEAGGGLDHQGEFTEVWLGVRHVVAFLIWANQPPVGFGAAPRSSSWSGGSRSILVQVGRQ